MNVIIKIMTVLLSVLTVSTALHAQENQVDAHKKTSCIPVRTVAEKELAYQAGERLHFTLHYEWGAIRSDVATATVSLDSQTLNGHDVFHVKVDGRTTRLYDFFFKIREDFQAWFTRDGLRPLKFTRDTREGRYRATNEYVYDWSAAEPHIAADVYSSSRGKGRRQLELPLDPCTFDLPALFFYARNMDFDVVEPGR